MSFRLPLWQHIVAALVTQSTLLATQVMAYLLHLPWMAFVAIACLQALVGIVLSLGSREAVQILDEIEDVVVAARGKVGEPTREPPVPPEAP